jgi:hypothetical protein
MVTYGDATLPQAREQARRFRSKAKVQDVSVVDRVILSAAGARVIVRKISRIEADGRVRRACAISAQDLRRSGGGVRSLGRTDTLYRCPAASR